MTDAAKTKTHAGFAVLVGRSNVGKSTLLNALVGSKIAITSPKPQTTRLPIHGIVTKGSSQIVFVDTPGLMKGREALTKKLLGSVKESMRDIDVIVHVVDPTREIGDEEKGVIRMIKDFTVPKILVINKIDLPRLPFIDHYRDLAPDYDAVLEVSAERGSHVNKVIEAIGSRLPEADFLYPEFQLTNLPNEVWLAELIREKLFLRLRQEVPYSTHVVVDEVDTRDNGVLYIRARVLTTSERYQRMIIGRGAVGIREIGQAARRELETVKNGKVFLDLTVEVDPHWMDRYE
jgi:GTP-binding protein Era